MSETPKIPAFTSQERETSLLWDETTRCWDVWTNIPKHMRLFQRIAEAHDVTPALSPEGRMRVILPEKAVSFRRPITMTVTDEQREAARVRLQAARARKIENT